MKGLVKKYNEILADKSPEEVIAFMEENHPGQVVFSTSLGLEDQVLTDMIVRSTPQISIFTLDTGRLFQETYDILAITEKKYGIRINIYFPDTHHVEMMVAEKGINLFYESVENRKLCCHIRKVEPLQRALTGRKVWITGLRRDQSVTRQDSGLIEWDEGYGLIKVNPLVNWSFERIWETIRELKIPYNELHNKGFPSVGCLPCTRAVAPGEDLRSGRWWWELPEFKECGLHAHSPEPDD